MFTNCTLQRILSLQSSIRSDIQGTRFKEGCNINRSLFTLGQVIKKLTDENQK